MKTLKPAALITGASSGIGRSLSEIFAREGYDLILVGRDEEALHYGQRESEIGRAHV